MTAVSTEPSTPAFLTQAGPAERKLGRSVVTLILGGSAAVVAGLAIGMVVMFAGAALFSRETGKGLFAALQLLNDSDRPGRTPPSYIYELVLAGLVLITPATALLAVAARRAGRPIRSFLTTAPRFRWSHALAGLLVFLPVVAVEIGVETLSATGGPGSPLFADAAIGGRLAYAAAAIVFLWLAALAEEMIFRGWLLQQTGALVRSVAVVLVVNAVIFSLAHGDPSLGAFVTRCALGAGWAWIVLRLGGIEFAAGAHFANNLGIALLAKPVLLTPPKPEPFDILSVALQVGTVAALAAGVAWWTRRNTREARAVVA
jgi:CAAX protease family protein